MKALFRISLIILFLFSCKEEYVPDIAVSNDRLLVVEGMINVGGTTQIKLSRTTNVYGNNGNGLSAEIAAKVTVEASNNQVYLLTHKQLGIYETDASLDLRFNYRLRIVVGGEEYVTDFMEPKIAPPIDNITWEAKENGLQFYVDTHDDSKSSRYYRWDFEDTWVFFSSDFSYLIWTGGGMRIRDRERENIYRCWSSSVSNNIVVGSSMKLTDDVISKQPIAFVQSNSEKLSEKYSILVKQYTLSKEAFEFWDNLRKNTEGLGSIFDALPSQLTGNIKNVKNPNEPVLGYISVGRSQAKRIFVSRTNLPDWKPKEPFDCADPDTVLKANVGVFALPNNVPLTEVFNNNGDIIGYTRGQKYCVDCTTRGSNKQPDYWQ